MRRAAARRRGMMMGAVADTYAATVLADSPDGFWRLDDNLPTSVVLDSSGNAYDMGLADSGGAVNTEDVSQAGLITEGTAFDLSLGRFAEVIDAALSPGGSAITIECWLDFPAHPGSLGNWGIFTHHGGLSTDSPWRLIHLTGNLNWGVRAPGGSLSSTTWNWASIANSVAHVVGRYDGANVEIFVNGAQVGTPTAYTGTIQIATTIPVTIGGYAGGVNTEWNGPMDECAVYFSALSDERILAHYNAGIA